MLQPIVIAHKHLSDYASIVGRPLVDEIRERAERLRGKRVLHLSAPAFGGGVSEILYTLVPLMVDVGLFLVPNVEECAQRSLEILTDPGLGKQLGRAGKESARRHFLTPRLLRDWLRMFEELGI